MNFDILKNSWTPYIFGPILVGSLYFINDSHWYGLSAWASLMILTGCTLVRISEWSKKDDR